MKCTKFKPHVSGCLQGFADFYIDEIGGTVQGFSLFMKGGQTWVKPPGARFIAQDGQEAENPFLKFEDREQRDDFSRRAKQEIDRWCKDKGDEQRQERTSVNSYDIAPF